MPNSSIRLDHAGIAEMLKSTEVADAVAGLADTVAEAARADETVSARGVPVVVDQYETDRAASSVTMTDPRARAIEARYAPLVRAANAAGLEVNENRHALTLYTRADGSTRLATRAQARAWGSRRRTS